MRTSKRCLLGSILINRRAAEIALAKEGYANWGNSPDSFLYFPQLEDLSHQHIAVIVPLESGKCAIGVECMTDGHPEDTATYKLAIELRKKAEQAYTELTEAN